MKHRPFQSIYRPEFEVVEQRLGNQRLYPHTDQLPLLLRALNLEFYGGLPGHIARTDKRADGFHKYLIRMAALLFCATFNRARADELRLFPLPDQDLVTKIAIVQQVSESHPLGRRHSFRFYGNEGFLPEIHLSGRRIAFADHVLQRFSLRVPNNVGEDLSNFLLVFYGTPFISMGVGQGRAFILAYHNSILAFTYRETDGEFFVTTCLTVREMNSLKVELPPRALNLHYGPAFVRPKIRNWIPTAHMMSLYHCWRDKVLPPPAASTPCKSWQRSAALIKDTATQWGHGPGSRLCFVDNLPGPAVLDIRPKEIEPVFDELDGYKKAHPEYDWDTIFAELDGGKPAK